MRKTSKFLLLCILLLSSYSIKAQVPISIKVDYKGKTAEIIDIHKDLYSPYLLLLIDGKEEKIKGFNDINLSVKSLKDFWVNQAYKGKVYENILKNSYQYDLRKDLEIDALNYLNKLSENQLLVEDQYLENYLYSLICKIFPEQLNDGRPGILNIVIMKDSDPNAFICQNGSMVITTGFLSVINSEEELVAAMAHEISHFVLDHTVININKEIKRQKSAEFWSALLTGVAAASEVYAASKNEYYVPGAVTYATAVLAYSISNGINKRLGLEFSREQELEADLCAIEMLNFNQKDPTALSSVLNKIKNHSLINGDYYSLSGEGTHPNISERIRIIGTPKIFKTEDYDKIFSRIISQNAVIEFNQKHFIACQSLVNRNISSCVPMEDDYILKAITNLYMFNTDDKNNEALELINKAKQLNMNMLILPKQEALVLIRLNRNQDAIKELENYMVRLNEKYLGLDKILNQYRWTSEKDFLDNEKEWTASMIYKLKNL
jgi:beta-barrel assembly-enhancing protease